MNEQELRELLGLSADANIQEHVKGLLTTQTSLRETLQLDEGADIVAAVTELNAEIAPLKEVQKLATTQKKFAEEFPVEYAEMQTLKETRIEASAATFAAQYERFTKKDGEKEVKSTQGFPMVTLNKIEECHKSISSGSFSHADLEALLNNITQIGFVEFAELGSNRQPEPGLSDPIQQFAKRVETLMIEDKMEPKDATLLAAKNHPDEYEAYREAMSQRTKTHA